MGVNTFSYYADKRGALARYRELLRPEGRLVAIDMNGASLTQQLAYLLNYRGARRFKPNVDESRARSLTEMLETAGYRVERMERCTFVPNEVGPAATLLLSGLDTALAHLPGIDRFAFRILWAARRC